MLKRGLNSIQLKYLALVFMLCDHLWATIISGNDWLTNIGRLAFPIFAFQLVEGYFHTSDYKKYCKRLFIFALISEIPFNLMLESSIIFPFHQNVMFIGLIAIHNIELMKEDFKFKYFAMVALMAILSIITFPDYGFTGFLTIMLFYITRDIPYSKVFQLAGMLYLHWFSFEGRYMIINLFGHTFEIASQAFAVLSLIFIWLYNGENGTKNKYVRTFAYWFYPVHMLCLYLIAMMTSL